MAVIEADGLTKYYGETRGIEGVTFSVPEGEAFGLLGPDGAGKTTAIRTLMGLQSPTSGGATVLGHDITSGRDIVKMKREVGYLPSEPSFDGELTGRQLLSYHATLKPDERSDELLELFDVPLDRQIGDYTRAETKKTAVVLSFMHDPDLAILDEPTTELDPLSRERFYDFIHTENAQGTTVFLSSSALSEVCTVCDRIGIVRNGHLLTIEESERLLDRDGKSVQVKLAETVDPDEFAFRGTSDITVETRDGNTTSQPAQQTTTVSFTYTGEYNALFEQLLEYTVIDVAIDETPLESVFTRWYGKRLV